MAEEQNPIKFDEYLKLVKESRNPVAALTWAFERLHTLSSDDTNGFSRMGQIWKLAHRDTGFLFKMIWISASDSIAGSHLNYLQGKISKFPPKFPPAKPVASGHADMDVVK